MRSFHLWQKGRHHLPFFIRVWSIHLKGSSVCPPPLRSKGCLDTGTGSGYESWWHDLLRGCRKVWQSCGQAFPSNRKVLYGKTRVSSSYVYINTFRSVLIFRLYWRISFCIWIFRSNHVYVYRFRTGHAKWNRRYVSMSPSPHTTHHQFLYAKHSIYTEG